MKTLLQLDKHFLLFINFYLLHIPKIFFSFPYCFCFCFFFYFWLKSAQQEKYTDVAVKISIRICFHFAMLYRVLVLNRKVFFNRTGECLKKAKICRLRPTTATDDKITSNFAKCILFKVLRHLNTESNANYVLDCANKVFFKKYVSIVCRRRLRRGL